MEKFKINSKPLKLTNAASLMSATVQQPEKKHQNRTEPAIISNPQSTSSSECSSQTQIKLNQNHLELLQFDKKSLPSSFNPSPPPPKLFMHHLHRK